MAKVVVRWSGDNDGSGWFIIRSDANAPLADSENRPLYRLTLNKYKITKYGKYFR